MQGYFKTLQIFLTLTGLLLISLNFYFFMYQPWQTWNENPMFMGEPLQEYYNNNFLDYSKLVDSVPTILILLVPCSGLIFFGIFISRFPKLALRIFGVLTGGVALLCLILLSMIRPSSSLWGSLYISHDQAQAFVVLIVNFFVFLLITAVCFGLDVVVKKKEEFFE